MSAEVLDAGVELLPDRRRVVTRLFLPGEGTPGKQSRTQQVIDRVIALSADELAATAARLVAEFSDRDVDLEATLLGHAATVYRDEEVELDRDQSIVLGAIFSSEYSVEGAALCNPSPVPHPDQSGLESGELRVVIAVRGVGEGHVSSIGFATAVVGPRGWVFDERARPLVRPSHGPGSWTRTHLRAAFESEGRMGDLANAIVRSLPIRFDGSDVDRAIEALPAELVDRRDSRDDLDAIRTITRSAYRSSFDPASGDVSARVLMPAADEERHGMEDARFVRFVDDDGTVDYRATYTAYDGHDTASRLIVTTDFTEFAIHRLTGAGSRTKGMALFPRRIAGEFRALTRTGGELISVATSKGGLIWKGEVPLPVPQLLWEVVQGGNCGSPIETDRGWLVLTHGVGPLRSYSIGAILLDLDDPTIVLARTMTPLLTPDGDRQNGYVPNVVYSCGAIVHDGTLWIPFGVGDDHIRVASVPLEELLDSMTPLG